MNFTKLTILIGLWMILGCGELEPSGECTNDMEQCSGNSMELCVEGAWKPFTDCSLQGQTCTMESGRTKCAGVAVEDSDTNSDTDEDTNNDTNEDTNKDTNEDTNKDTNEDSDSGPDTGSVPEPYCGDGTKDPNEECDDGNTEDVDGCSSACVVEPPLCHMENCSETADCTITMVAAYRDFSGDHSDFEVGCDGLVTGALATELDGNSKPTAVSGEVDNWCTSNFGDWYAGDAAKTEDIILYSDGKGTITNRFGSNGEKFVGKAYDQSCDGGDCVPCKDDSGANCHPPAQYTGNPLFFPVDDLGSELAPAKIPPDYGWDWSDEEYALGTAVDHNFYFTSEIAYSFEYRADTPATLRFMGDDDVWVFINGQLAVDLGGLHVPEEGSVTIGSEGESFGMTDGESYEIKIFHAERKMEGSSFMLELTDFHIPFEVCVPW